MAWHVGLHDSYIRAKQTQVADFVMTDTPKPNATEVIYSADRYFGYLYATHASLRTLPEHDSATDYQEALQE
jgi:hypothetical protein